MPPVVGDSSTPSDPGVKGTGFIGMQGIGLPGGIGVSGGPPSDQPIPVNFIGVKGDGGAGMVAAGFPIGLPHIGVLGTASDPAGSGVQGVNALNNGVEGNGNVGVVGTGATIGILGLTNTAGQGLAGSFHGNVEVTANLQVDGGAQVSGNLGVGATLTVTEDIVLAGRAGDCAEDFDVDEVQAVEPGTVMILNESGLLRPSEQAYDRKVVGVISGAGGYRPGMILDRRDSTSPRAPIALLGRVYCKADAEYGPISVGDLLTTSPTLGHAMKASDPLKAFGTVIGKALGNLSGGKGLVPVLVALQ
ncbi:MAG: hypothetical protein WBX22_19365 [Silvibacterium sp.]